MITTMLSICVQILTLMSGLPCKYLCFVHLQVESRIWGSHSIADVTYFQLIDSYRCFKGA